MDINAPITIPSAINITGNITIGAAGKSAYQSYLGQTTDDPVLTEAEWLESLHGVAGTTTWAGITDKPTEFPPSSHSHAISDVSMLQTSLNGKMDGMLENLVDTGSANDDCYIISGTSAYDGTAVYAGPAGIGTVKWTHAGGSVVRRIAAGGVEFYIANAAAQTGGLYVYWRSANVLPTGSTADMVEAWTAYNGASGSPVVRRGPVTATMAGQILRSGANEPFSLYVALAAGVATSAWYPLATAAVLLTADEGAPNAHAVRVGGAYASSAPIPGLYLFSAATGRWTKSDGGFYFVRGSDWRLYQVSTGYEMYRSTDNPAAPHLAAGWTRMDGPAGWLVVTVRAKPASYIGQLLRYGNAAPYTWYKAAAAGLDTTVWETWSPPVASADITDASATHAAGKVMLWGSTPAAVRAELGAVGATDDAIAFSGTSLTAPNQTLTGDSSMLTRALGDARYVRPGVLATSLSATYHVVGSAGLLASSGTGIIGARNSGDSAFVDLKARNFISDNTVQLKSFTVAAVPSASVAGAIIYVSNESGGAVMAFADGTNWRRVTDRAIIS